jgi:hypothetical protein
VRAFSKTPADKKRLMIINGKGIVRLLSPERTTCRRLLFQDFVIIEFFGKGLKK